MDVYVATTGKVRLLDFNPVGGFTAPLLFDWDELGYGEHMLSHTHTLLLSFHSYHFDDIVHLVHLLCTSLQVHAMCLSAWSGRHRYVTHHQRQAQTAADISHILVSLDMSTTWKAPCNSVLQFCSPSSAYA